MSLFNLVLTTVLILSACYTTFNSRIKSETRNEAYLMAALLDNSGDSAEVLSYPELKELDRRIIITNPDGSVYYKNHDRSAGGESVEEDTLLSGFAQNVYSCNIQLKSGRTLTVGSESGSVTTMFMRLFLPIIAMVGLIYVLCTVFAVNLTDNITKPINNVNPLSGNYENVYPELRPFLKRISGQNEEIKRQMEKVKRQKMRLQAVSENMNEGLIVLDKNRDIISANNSALSIFDCGEDPVHHEFSYLTDNDILTEGLNEALEGEKLSTVCEISGKSFRVFFSPVFENKLVSGVIILMFDISEEMKTIQIRREFSANVSHELKTPLTTILGYSQLINNGIAKDEDIKSFTKKIENETSRLITLIDDIIKLSKLDEGGEENEFHPVHLLECAKEAVSALEARAGERGISIELEGEDSVVFGNLHQIDELFFNLCDNAIKYNKDNGSVTIKIFDRGFSVSDTGIGIPEEYRERIFERFFRVDKSRSKKVNGTGLGLSIVKHIIICHNASIGVESTPGEGTTFTVTFPQV